MAVMLHSTLVVLFLSICSIFPVSCQQGSPQNIETFYPYAPPPPPVALPPPLSPPPPATQPPRSPPLPPLPTSPAQPPPPSKSLSTNGTIALAVVASAAGSLGISAVLFFLIRRHSQKKLEETSARGPQPTGRDDFFRFDGNIKGLIVDENGLDVLYWRKLQSASGRSGFRKEVMHGRWDGEQEVVAAIPNGSRQRNSDPIQEVPLLREKSTRGFNKIQPQEQNGLHLKDVEMSMPSSQQRSTSPPPPPPPPSPPLPPPLTPGTTSPAPEVRTALAIPSAKSSSPPPPAPPPPPVPKARNARSPPPPPPPKVGGLASASKAPPPLPKAKLGDQSGKNHIETGQVKLKPLHWDKVNTNTDHSMVWNKIGHGSFKFDDDLMEALFGSVATNHRSPQGKGDRRNTSNLSSPGPSGQIFILDPRKSQNVAIVLKSLTVSRKQILDALCQGRGLDTETLEKLNRIAPTKEEELKIFEFSGESMRLADAESFLYHLLKAMPSAFTRFSAMLFKSNFQADVLQLKETLQTLESACKELRTRGIFMKLLEAILKAGNRMNQGTSRGNAQAFNLTSLRKLSDVKSADGKTTLLHFIVEEVVRAEGKRCVINRDRGLSRSSSQSSNASASSEHSKPKEEREKEYMLLGLPLVGGLSSEFSNVKKAAVMDYESFSTSCEALKAHASEIRQLVLEGCGEGGPFIKEMEGFLRAAEDELSALRRQQTAVMEVVKRTTEYYQAGASREKGGNPLHLFVMVKDFLNMVDKACVEISRNQQRRKTSASSSTESSPLRSPPKRPGLRFPVLSPDFFSPKAGSASSESDPDL